MGHCNYKYPDVFFVTYREYLIRKKAHLEQMSMQMGYLRTIVFHMITGNPYIKKEHKPKKEQDLWLLPTEQMAKKKTIKPTTMTPHEAEFFRKCGFNVDNRHIS